MIILKNLITSDVKIEDLGIIIPGSSVYNLTDTFKLHEIVASDDLKTKINDETLIINDGVIDLNKEDGLKHITYETVYEDKLQVGKISDLNETITYSMSWVKKLELNVNLEAANYLLDWSFEIKSNDNIINNFCETRILVNNLNVIATNSWLYSKYQYFNGIDIGKFMGNFYVCIEFRRQGNYQPVSIQNAKMSLVKLE